MTSLFFNIPKVFTHASAQIFILDLLSNFAYDQIQRDALLVWHHLLHYDINHKVLHNSVKTSIPQSSAHKRMNDNEHKLLYSSFRRKNLSCVIVFTYCTNDIAPWRNKAVLLHKPIYMIYIWLSYNLTKYYNNCITSSNILNFMSD